MERTATQALELDLKKLQARAYHFAEWAEEVLCRYHAIVAGVKDDDKAGPMRRLYRWMFVPPTLWPFNVRDVLAAYLSKLEKGKGLTARERLMIDMLPEPPDETVCLAVADHEREVQQGRYEHLVRMQAKYDQNELAITTDPELRRQWEQIKSEFTVRDFCDHKGVIRRTMGAERNMRPGFYKTPRLKAELFQAAFDAFCLRWNLYGMQHDDPLVLKLAVNVTPYGTMIMIPSYWSFDPKRDMRWDTVACLHRPRAAKRQGPAIAGNLAQRMERAARLPELDQEVLRRGLRGQRKHEFLCKALGLSPESSPKRISRLRAEFKK